MKVIRLHNDEKQLISKAMLQNRKAQHQLYQMFAPKMLSVCRYYINDIQQAEEAMLNGFFKVFKNLKQYRNEGSFEGWIRRIMVRTCISELRKKSKFNFYEKVDIEDTRHDPINSNLAVAEIQQLIDKLPDGYRIVFVMYAIEGYKHTEISQELGISEGTSKSQLFKARQILQQEIIKLNQSSYGTN